MNPAFWHCWHLTLLALLAWLTLLTLLILLKQSGTRLGFVTINLKNVNKSINNLCWLWLLEILAHLKTRISFKYCLSFRRGRTEPFNSSAPLLTSSSLYCHQKALHSEDAGVEGIFGGFDDPWSGPHLHGKANSVEGGLGAGGGRLLCRGRPDDHQLLHGVEGGACLLHGDQSTHIWPHLSWGDSRVTFE